MSEVWRVGTYSHTHTYTDTDTSWEIYDDEDAKRMKYFTFRTSLQQFYYVWWAASVYHIRHFASSSCIYCSWYSHNCPTIFRSRFSHHVISTCFVRVSSVYAKSMFTVSSFVFVFVFFFSSFIIVCLAISFSLNGKSFSTCVHIWCLSVNNETHTHARTNQKQEFHINKIQNEILQ